jgi:hypothetical protein
MPEVDEKKSHAKAVKHSSNQASRRCSKALGHTQSSTTARYAQLAESVQREALGNAGARMLALKGTAKRATVVKLNAVDAA